MEPIKYFLAEDTINNQDVDRLIDWLKGYPRLTKGKVTVEFEEKWSKWLGSEYSVFCNSGSSANLLMAYALYALDLEGKLRNKKIIVPSVGWVTTIAPFIQLGFEPIMCEADSETFALDLNHLDELLGKHDPATVILVQVLGVPHKMDAIMGLKEKYKFILLEDACAAIGAEYRGKKIGTFGDMSSFSFYFGHQMSTIEGGMVSTNNYEFRNYMLMGRSHGWSKDLDRNTHEKLIKKHEVDDFHSPFVFYVPGFNLRSTDLQAYIGIGQLDKLDWFIGRRNENHARYLSHLYDKLYFQKAPHPDTKICSISCGALAESTEQRNRIVSALVKNGIETRIFSAGNLGLHPFWYSKYGKSSFPMADKIHTQGFFLPNHPTLTIKHVDFISKVVLNAL
jgi:CDP-4-dehydro-6-deoxyglucose reductase, E1